MFFTQINSMMNQGVDITLVIRKKEGQLMVSLMPKANGLKDEAQNHIVPLTITGTPEELDMGFLPTICQPVQKTTGLLLNMSQFEKQADKAAEHSKAAKELKDKEAKDAKEKKEKFDSLMKKVAELETGQKLAEAMTCLQQAKLLATPQALQSVDQKINGLRLKLSQGNLFGMEPAPQPVQVPVANRQQPVMQPQPAVQQPIPQPVQGYVPQNGQQVYRPQTQPGYNNATGNNGWQATGQQVMDYPPEPEPEMVINTGYPAHREGEYDQYPDFPYQSNHMYNPQNR